MKTRVVLGSATLLTLSVLFAGCGNMNTVIAKDNSYRMDAFVGSRNLDDGAAISASDAIRPSFSSQAEDDPDVTGIRVSLETEAGTIAAGEVVYRLSSDTASREAGETPVLVPRFSGELPSFTLPPDLTVGRYVLIMSVLGADGVLFERKRSIYYLADAHLTLSRIVSYPPGTGTSSTAPLFPTNTKMLLRAEISADARLDPYVAWYFGAKRIGLGRLADGANQILWTTPAREGFQTVRVEVYPEPPVNPKEPGIIGASADITVATSASASAPGLSGVISDYLRLFHFLGELTDSDDSERSFARTNGAEPVWSPLENSYGLSLGANDQYLMEYPLAPVRSGGIDSSRVLTRVAIPGTGPIWRASFPTADGSDSLHVLLSATVGGFELRLLTDRVQRSAFVASAMRPEDEAYSVDVTFSVERSSVTASISVDGGGAYGVALQLSSSLNGDGTVRLGGPEYPASQAEGGGSDEAVSPTTAVIDELAVLPSSALVADN